jgi:large subunit ribosomal protein L46
MDGVYNLYCSCLEPLLAYVNLPRSPKKLAFISFPMLRPLIHASVVLNRAPFLTRTPTVFESAYYEYQGRIRRALHNPFPYEFYFKHGSPMEARFMREERDRERKAFGESFSEGDDDTGERYESEREVLMSREHEADRQGDMKSLDRKGDRTLYLLLQERGGEELWRFPRGRVEKGELLHQVTFLLSLSAHIYHAQAAQRDLYTECGERIDIWVVSQTPIGFYEVPSQTKQRVSVDSYCASIVC